jgi:hypothetical protein
VPGHVSVVWGGAHERDPDVDGPRGQEPVHEGLGRREGVGVLLGVEAGLLLGRRLRTVVQPLAAARRRTPRRVRGRAELVRLSERGGFGPRGARRRRGARGRECAVNWAGGAAELEVQAEVVQLVVELAEGGRLRDRGAGEQRGRHFGGYMD